MPSKYYYPRQEDMDDYDTIIGQFPCQIDECDQTNDSARHYTKPNVFAWQCANGHLNKVDASHYV